MEFRFRRRGWRKFSTPTPPKTPFGQHLGEASEDALSHQICHNPQRITTYPIRNADRPRVPFRLCTFLTTDDILLSQKKKRSDDIRSAVTTHIPAGAKRNVAPVHAYIHAVCAVRSLTFSVSVQQHRSSQCKAIISRPCSDVVISISSFSPVVLADTSSRRAPLAVLSVSIGPRSR
jgi:hypothetical protein